MTERNYSMTPSAIAGVLLALLGILLTLDNFSYIDASSWLRFWPAVLVVLGLIKATRPGTTSGRTVGLVVAVVGIIMVLNRADIVHISITALWPLLLVALGLSFVLRSGARKDVDGDASSDTIRGAAILGGMEQKISSRFFSGGTVSAILGGHDIDLREADIPDRGEAVLDVFAFMGGIEIKVPQSWTVIVDGSAILGGFENRTTPGVHGLKTLRITGTAIMGGVEIKS